MAVNIRPMVLSEVQHNSTDYSGAAKMRHSWDEETLYSTEFKILFSLSLHILHLVKGRSVHFHITRW